MRTEEEKPDLDIEEDPFEALRKHDLLHLFDELSFRRKWIRVFKGLKQPITSGENKWARLQLLRLLAPFAAVIVPVIMLFFIAFLAQFTPRADQTFEVTVVDPEPMEELEDIEPPDPEDIEPPEPVDVEVEVDTDVAAETPSEVEAPSAEDASVQPAEFDAVADVRSPVQMTGMLSSRNPGTRGEALGQYGGGHTTEAVLRALRWLAVNQNEDGSWGNTKPAMTSLALLSYLAHGDTPASEEFGTVVERGLRFLIGAQQDNGHFRGRDRHDYTQPIAAYALAEAYGMTRTPQVREAAIKAIERVVEGQNPAGSWDYRLDASSDRNDISYAGWCVQALKAAEIAGLTRDVPGIKDAMEKAVDGIKANFRERNDVAGFGYTNPSHTHGLSGVGVLALQFLGQGDSREAQMALAGLGRWPFDWEEPRGRSPVYWWYYNTQAYFQEGGDVWDNWNEEFSHTMVDVQQVIDADESEYVDHTGTARAIGFWDSPADSELTGGNGRVMDTILCTLMLEVYYRYLPTFQQIEQEEIERELGDEDDLVIEIVQTRPDVRELKDMDMVARIR